MKAIETEYEGYRFRSRLEARWAVFFDSMEFVYQYEPEGFTLPWILTPSWSTRKRLNYLPDFWLPEFNMWAEVKGSWTEHAKMRTLNAIAALDHPTLILGDTFRQPRKGSTRPYRLSYSRNTESIHAEPWPPIAADDSPSPIISRTEGFVDHRDLLRGHTTSDILPEAWYDASKAAQRARFEFGETPGR